MKLIIAEKPSQAREYAKALGGFTSKDGYMESNQYYLTWCFGHLIGLVDDKQYHQYSQWSLDYLPLIPNQYKYQIGLDEKKKTDKGKKKQIEIIEKLAKKSTSIINGTDADREGELIFLYVYNFLNLKIPFQRLWISSLTEDEIKKGFLNLLNAQEMENLGKSAYARAISDWLIGVNGTQSATLKLGNRKLLTIGRVQTAILKIICERFLKNQSHTKTYTYKIKSQHQHNGIDFIAESPIYENEKTANEILKQVDKNNHTFVSKEEKETKHNCPLLYSIDTLIMECNKIYGMNGKTTLSIAQSLYEKKLTTYPRTDSNYINIEGYEKLKQNFHKVTSLFGIEFEFLKHTPKSVNDKKITGSHDAIVPTCNINSFSSLTENEKKVYQLIILKCCQSFHIAGISNRTTYNFINNEIPFTYSNMCYTKLGWLQYLLNPFKIEKPIVLNIEKGEKLKIDAIKLFEIESKPPALYTDATITKSLTNISKFLEEENPELLSKLKQANFNLKDCQLGTQATRPLILERLQKLGYVSVKKKKYTPTPFGLSYYETIKDLKITNVGYTAVLEKDLKEIATGNVDDKKYYQKLNKYVSNVVGEILNLESKIQIEEKKSFGKCPKCKEGEVLESKKGYGCSMYSSKKCNFVIWKTISNKKLTQKNVKDLILKGITSSPLKMKNKAGKSFSAKLKLNKDFRIEYVFED